GEIEGRQTTRRFAFRFPQVERERDFVARLWATRRVGHLLEEIRLHGEHQELKDEVIMLAKAFGLVTPYTSYLVQEEEMMAGTQHPFIDGSQAAVPPEGAIPFDEVASAPLPREAMNQTSGADAVAASKRLRAMQEAEALPQASSG